MNGWWQSLAVREQGLVAGGGVVLLLVAGYLGAIEPFYARYRQAQAAAQQARADVAWMQQAVDRLPSAGKAGATSANGTAAAPLLVRIDALAAQFAVNQAIRRIEPQGSATNDGPNALLVQFEGVEFDALMEWLVAVTAAGDVTVTQARLDRRVAEVGRVDARLILTAAPPTRPSP